MISNTQAQCVYFIPLSPINETNQLLSNQVDSLFVTNIKKKQNRYFLTYIIYQILK